MLNLHSKNNNPTLMNIKYHVEIKADDKTKLFDVYDFTGNEYLNDDFNYRINIVSDNKYDVSYLLNLEATLVLTINGQKRRIKGYIFNVKSLNKNGKYFMYELTLNSWLGYLKHITYCRIYENSTSIEIIKQAISEVSTNLHIDCAFKFDLYSKKYPHREYCVQYNENVYDFICRLMEEDGFYMQIEDNVVNFYDLNKCLTQKENIYALVNEEASIFSSDISYSSYDYQHPTQHFRGTQKGLIHDEEEGYVKDKQIHNKLSTHIFIDRMNKLNGEYEKDILNRASIGSYRNMTIGGTMNATTKNLMSYAGIVCHIIDNLNDFNKKSIITTSKYTGTSHNSLQEYADTTEGGSFSCEFSFINDEIFYRPPLKRHKNRINSKQIAVVGGADEKEKYIDDMGRVKVKFFWNALNYGGNDALSCWVRLSQFWNGNKNGSMFIPQVGQEVLVAFINGDPDYPVVDGMLYNESNVAKNDWQTKINQWSITSKSSDNSSDENYSQIMFDSTSNKEEIYIQSQKDFNILVKNNEKKDIKKNHTLEIGGKQNIKVAGDYALRVTNNSLNKSKNSKELIKQDKILAVENTNLTQVLKNNNLLMHTNRLNILQGKNEELFSGSSLEYYEDIKNTFIGNNNQTQIVGTSIKEIQKDSQLKVNGTLRIESKDNILINSEKGISLTCGGNFITIDSSGVHINGSSVGINSGGKVLEANEVPVQEVTKPVYNLLRVKSISGDVKEEENKFLNFKLKVERFEDDKWTTVTSITKIEKAQITYGVDFNNKSDRLNEILYTVDPKPGGLNLKCAGTVNKDDKYIHVYAYVNDIKTEGYTNAHLNRLLEVQEIEGSELAEPNGKLNYTAITNLEDLDDKEKNRISWKVEYTQYVNEQPSNIVDEHKNKGDILSIKTPKDLADSLIKITAYENHQGTQAVFHTTGKIKKIKESETPKEAPQKEITHEKETLIERHPRDGLTTEVISHEKSKDEMDFTHDVSKKHK